jgi:hypothetical protein
MRRDDERRAGLDSLSSQQFQRLRRVHVVEIGRRLVGQHERRTIHHRPRDRDALCLPLRQLRRKTA